MSSTSNVVVRNSGSSIGFSGLLTLLFIGLKLGGVINWSWLWVLSPMWLPLAIVVTGFIIAAVVVFIVAGVVMFIDKITSKTK